MTRAPRLTTINYGDSPPDTGCEVSVSCLRCPLVRCRYDTTPADREAERQHRDAAIREDYRQAMATRVAGAAVILAIAERHGVSRRTVHRAVAQGKEQGRG